jgi:hypothetical protein
MSAGCNNAVGSRFDISLIRNLNCEAVPKLITVEADTAGVVGGTTLSIALNALAHPINGEKYYLTSPHILYFGAGFAPVEVLPPSDGSGVYTITTTSVTVNVKRLTTAIPVDATALSYLGIHACLKSANIATSTTSQDNTTNCTGELETMLNISYSKKMNIAGYVSSQDFGYYLMKVTGQALGSFFFALDYDRKQLVTGVVQITDPNIQGNEVKNIVSYDLEGQVQSISHDSGSYFDSLPAQTEAANIRRLYGLKTSVATFII